jgi:hypothetical protein
MRTRIRFHAGLAVVVTLALPPLFLSADVLIMKDGKTFEGEVTEEADVYVVKTSFGVLKVDKVDVEKRVTGPEAMVAEAETLRVTAKALIDGATSEPNPTQKSRTLGAAVEILQKALETYTKAREIFKEEKYAHLDKAAAEVIREIQAAKEKMPAEAAPPPVTPPSTGGNQPIAGDLLAPPTPPSFPPVAKVPEVPETPPMPVPVPVEDPVSVDTPAGKMLAEARDFIERKRTREALRVLNDLFKEHGDDPAAVAALPLFNDLPHPDGRMICGFDTPEDIRAWRLSGSRGTTFALTTKPVEIREGIGAGRITALRTRDHSTGAICLELGKFDERRFRGLTITVFQARPSLGRFEIAFIRGNQSRLPWISSVGDSEIGACFYWATPLKFVGWRKFKISAQQFQARGSGGVSGKIGWHDVGALVIYDAARRGMDVAIDSLRFIELSR